MDECLPKKLKLEFKNYEVSTVYEQGWSGIKNGELLKLAQENRFDVFLTADQNLKYQQNLSKSTIAIIILVARNNRIESLQPLIIEVHQVLEKIQPGQFILVPRTL